MLKMLKMLIPLTIPSNIYFINDFTFFKKNVVRITLDCGIKKVKKITIILTASFHVRSI